MAEQEVAKALQDLVELKKAKNEKALEYFADDCYLTHPKMPGPIKGKAAMVEFHTAHKDKMPDLSDLKMEIEYVRASPDGNRAYARCNVSHGEHKGSILTMLKKCDGCWKIFEEAGTVFGCDIK